MPPIAKSKSSPKTQPKPAEPTILYPDVEVRYYFQPGPGRTKGIGALTAAQAKLLVGWETEDDYKKRIEVEEGKASKKIIGYGDEYLLLDTAKRKIKCWYNDNNRPFTEKHAYELAQDTLNKKWRLNLENIIISRSGKVQSGQHRLIGLILAAEMWAKDKHWQAIWQTEPVLETLIAFGGAEDPETVSTLDNVRPRSLSDIFYTSPVFADLTSLQRAECSRGLDHAVDLLWRRTGAGSDKYNKYQTHSSSVDFFDKHPRLKVAVRFMLDHNTDKQISQRGLYIGHCAAMMYLMGCCTTDPDAYKLEPSEKSIDWKYWEKAVDFWRLFAGGKEEMEPVYQVLGDLRDVDTGSGAGRLSEKMSVIGKSWMTFLREEPLTKEEIKPKVGPDANGNLVLLDAGTFGGIDQGGKSRPVEEVPSPEELQKRAAEERANRLASMQKTVEQSLQKPTPKPKPAEDWKIGYCTSPSHPPRETKSFPSQEAARHEAARLNTGKEAIWPKWVLLQAPKAGPAPKPAPKPKGK